jgi:hypothetical protein
MLNFPRWKVIGIWAILAFGILLSVPSLLPPSVSDYLPGWAQRTHVNLGLDLRRIADDEAQLAAGGRDLADLDARRRGAHRPADRVFQQSGALARDVAGIRLEQQMAAAGEVETEIDVDPLRPCGQILRCGGRHQARHGQQDAEREDRPDPDHFPARKIEH